MFRLRALLVIPALTLALAACGNGDPAAQASAAGPAAASPVSGGTAAVTITEEVGSSAGYQFKPATQPAKVGQVVAWVNKSGAPHNVTFDDSSVPSSGSENPNDAYQLKFTGAGNFKYQCTIHPGMTAELDVTP